MRAIHEKGIFSKDLWKEIVFERISQRFPPAQQNFKDFPPSFSLKPPFCGPSPIKNFPGKLWANAKPQYTLQLPFQNTLFTPHFMHI